ncbi:single-stranded DNA-binding protein [Patescibacteria group bacterium]|nr:single-stranded DNA-binding protein [Patescibacteria group bacterium]MBU4458624.1 single-stranded DNA-binding protein [Patescibacteria group bacterium]MCG2695950.1 single-stranded DNA-binding protein [Candidatus Portnoybacteria bacterium]
MNLNKAFLIGNLTRDPESRTLPSGQSVSSFGLATNRVWTDSESKEKKQQVEFHNVVAFGKLAEICNQYLKKGSLTMIEGRIQTRNWQGQNGETKYKTEIIAERLQMGPRKDNKTEEGKKGSETEPTEQLDEIQVEEESPADEIKTEDIPF